MRSRTNNHFSTADDLVAILTYIVAYAEVPHIYSEFQLIQVRVNQSRLPVDLPIRISQMKHY